MDLDADSYLKRASRIKRQHFGKGFAALPAGVKPGVGTGGTSSSVVIENVEGSRSAVLPMKKRRRASSSSSDDEGKTRRQSATGGAPSPQSDQIQNNNSKDVEQPPKKRLTLIDKWFPGNTLKIATVEVAHAPSAEFIQNTTDRVTTARDSMITLRSGVEDLEGLLAEIKRSGGDGAKSSPSAENGRSVWQQADIAKHINDKTSTAVGEALSQLEGDRDYNVAVVRQRIARLMERKAALRTPVAHNMVKAWHYFIDVHGPETGATPSTSQLVWMDSPNTTTFFTILTQRLLRGFRSVSEEKEVAEDENEEEEIYDSSDYPEGQQQQQSGQSGRCWLSSWRPTTSSSDMTDSQRQLLVFLRFFMPTSNAVTASGSVLRSAGYGVWLMAALTALDTPLDPDTDRLVHDLFRVLCDQVRVLGEWKDIHGEQRGALLVALASAKQGGGGGDKEASISKAYVGVEDVGEEELRALYTIIITLARFFRQNQNRLIPL